MSTEKVSTSVLLCVVTLATSLHGQQPGGRRQLSPMPGTVDVASSRVFTFVKGTGVGHSHGMEAKLLKGHLHLGATRNAGQFVIDMKSFDADTPTARKAVGLKGKTAKWMRKQVRKEMLGKKILDAASFPEATLVIDSCTPKTRANEKGIATYQLAGTLTLRGVTNPISFPITAQQVDNAIRVAGNYKFKQSDFGIKPLSKGFGSIGVTDEVAVLGEIRIAPTAESLASLQSLQMRR